LIARLTRIETRAQAVRLTALYGATATCVSALASALIAIPVGQPALVEAVTGAAIAAVITPVLTWPLARAAVDLHERERRLEAQANTDAMTGILNRRGFFAAAAPIMAKGAPLCAMLLDLDSFKQINDTFGHAAGDAVVTAAAHAIRSAAEPHGALVGRIGGDEFCLLLPGADASAACALAERLRGAVETRIVHHEDRAIRVTASIGAALRRPEDTTLDDLLARADAALYAAKSMGRNRAAGEAPALRKSA
jgi:diguanylate cyclase (GGDEF)-like protein